MLPQISPIIPVRRRDLFGSADWVYERKKILRKVIPRKSSSVGCVSYVDRGALKLFELVKKGDLEGLVVKRKDGKYATQTLWYKVLNPTYTQKNGRQEFFQRQ